MLWYRRLGRPAENIVTHFEKENVGLCFTRQLLGDKWQNVFVTDTIIDGCTVSLKSREWTYIAPLYFYNGKEHKDMLELEFTDKGAKYANFSQNFIQNYIKKLKFEPTPEEILAYIYAVLHSASYRTKYIEFLKTDFPAVPMATNEAQFRQYASLGQQLIDLHLLKNVPDDADIRVSLGGVDGFFTIKSISHRGEMLYLETTEGKTIAYSGVPQAAYDFEIGSYRPIEKWLKYRIKDRVTLDIADLNHLKQMLIAIKQTIEVMAEIEKVGELSQR
ncbi:hypothetical protein AGMMS49965_18870 [Bacteroidia bacterium]|nr:hypothetical protein AGMMS49965_18870 [Bacteroidia bacterium]